MRASRLRWLIPTVVLVSIVLIPLLAWGQTPPPGEEPDVVRPWTWWLAIPVALGAVGLVLFIAMRYVRVSSRFFGKEEAPRIPERPRAYAGVNAPAYPAPAAVAAQPAPAPAPAAATATAEAPPAEPAPAPAQQPAPEPEPAPQAEPEAAPEPEPEPAPAEAEAQPEPQPEPAPEPGAEPAADEGDDVYERVLKEQLDKGVSPKVAEGRAKAAAHRARRSG